MLKKIGKNYIYGIQIKKQTLDALLKSAKKYEEDLYSQLVRLNNPDKYNDGKKHKVRDFSEDKLKKLLQNNNYKELNLNTPNETLEKLVEKVELATKQWLETTEDGKDYIEGGGFYALLDNIKIGGFRKEKTESRKPISRTRLDGLKKELIIGLKRAGWAYDLDENSVIVESNGFKNERYPEGSLDFVIKFDKENVGKKTRRPIAIEAKSNIDDFSIGSIPEWFIKKMLTPTKIIIDSDNRIAKIYLDVDIFAKAAEHIFEKKYLHGRDYNGRNTPIFEGYDGSIMLFSEFIKDIKNNGIGVRDFANTGPDFTVVQHILKETNIDEALLKKTYKDKMTADRSMQIWYGKSKK